MTMRSETGTIVCIPHAGAGALAFKGWRVRAGPSFVVVALPGREATQGRSCLRTIAEMAQHVTDFVDASGLAGVTFYGHSMGALVAYEASRSMNRRRPGIVRRLVVSGCRSPTSPPAVHLSAIADDEAFMTAVTDLGGLPPGAASETAVVAYLLPILRADIGAADAYRHEGGELLRVPLVAVGGDDDPFVPPPALAAWRDVAGAGFEQVVMPGNHFFIFEHADRMLRLLRA
jgi:medium-chain acyl-[acyl-carrier-protein] hydrolase